jgi:hypothetical protein
MRKPVLYSTWSKDFTGGKIRLLNYNFKGPQRNLVFNIQAVEKFYLIDSLILKINECHFSTIFEKKIPDIKAKAKNGRAFETSVKAGILH